MPYIEQIRRQEAQFVPDNAGELNYAITRVLIRYWQRKGCSGYQNINDIIGACESAKAEFQRRVVGKYEDQKILENGDVYA